MLEPAVAVIACNAVSALDPCAELAQFEVMSFTIVPDHLVSPLVTFAAAGTPLLIVTEAICFSTVALFKATP